MSNNVSTDRLRRVLSKRHSIWIGNDLIGHEHSHAKLLSKTSQLPQELSKLHLPLRQLSTSTVIRTEQCSGRVDNNECVTILGHDCSSHFEQFHLVFTVVGTGVGNVFEGNGWVHSESFGNGLETVGTESSFGVNVDGLSLSTTLRNGHLTRNTQRMAKLCLSRPKLPKHLRQTPRLNPTLQQLIQLRTPRSQRHQSLSILQCICRGLEIEGNHSLDNILEFEDFGLGETTYFG
mmetsp:Transcript_863/g.2032  ORF Transcript_863/g.2032 Transcript_863/m.2032 type:complete len:234 (+) Transcript_863:571-1272(+)